MKFSAGLLMYQKLPELRFFLVHPGGPFYKNKDDGSWTIPKGEPLSGEDFLTTALREFEEETGIKPIPPFTALGSIKQTGGKTVHAWAFEWTNPSVPAITSNTFQMEWPPRSGKHQEFPEVDKGGFFNYEQAVIKINQAQLAFLDELKEFLT